MAAWGAALDLGVGGDGMLSVEAMRDDPAAPVGVDAMVASFTFGVPAASLARSSPGLSGAVGFE